ncbi:MAG TPA: TonB-dependent receptor [Vicinamibacterales bacterium]
MNRSRLRLGLVVLFAVVFCACGRLAFAQGSTSQPLSGTVVDSSGAVIPGADVVVKHNGTGVANSTVSNSDGIFTIPALSSGTYTVTVSLQGFKTVVIENVVLTSGHGADVKATMEVGGVSEQVTVASSSEIIQTQTAGVAQTVNADQIVKLPLTSRGAMDFVNLLPGVTTPNGNRQASINGLPRTAINITLDGVNIQDNTNKGTSGDDGFFAEVNPRLDAVEEVTVSTAAQGTDANADGAAQIKFVTRAGSNNFTGSAYEYFRSDKYNANTWFNNAKGVAKVPLKQNQPGFRFGGPIVLPGFDGHNKAFFFVNYEEFHAPSAVSRTRTVLNQGAQTGNYCYGSTCVNVLKLNAPMSNIDPTIAKLLSDMNSAMGSTGTLTGNGNANQQSYNFNIPVQSLRRYPTGRVDYNISQNHRISSSVNYQYFYDFPDTLNQHEPAFPGFPGSAASQTSKRLAFSNSLRSTLSRNMVNEATVAYAWAPISFFPEEGVDQFNGSVANMNGNAIGFGSVDSSLTSPIISFPAPQSRNADTLDITDNLTWLKGSHSITMGGQVSTYSIWAKNSTAVPQVTLCCTTTTGLPSTDPAAAFFTTANFPGASGSQLIAAQGLFSMLTGRVSNIFGDARIDASTGQYAYMGTGLQEGALHEQAAYIQDQWRLKSNLTLNMGVRYDLQQPFSASNSIYSYVDAANLCGVSGANGDSACNLFQPGVMPGQHTVLQQYTAGTDSAKTDWNNFAPSVGMAWTPQSRPGFLGKLMGPNDFVVRGGYARSFSRPAIGDFTAIFNTNPGVRLTNQPSAATILANGGQSSVGALLLSNPLVQLPVPGFPASPSYPFPPTSNTNSIAAFNQGIQIPYSDTWQTGFTRSIGKDMALEVRYVGTHGYDIWGNFNYNQLNITSNGFLSEFRQAQANLQANLANNRGSTFAYTGAPGTAPLPTFLGFFQGLNASNAGNPAAYTSANFASTTFLAFLAANNPNPFGFASTNTTSGFAGSTTFRANGLTAGIPANYFQANPDVTNANVQGNRDSTYYNGLQTEFRRRFSQGLQFQVSYSLDHAWATTYLGFVNGAVYRRPTGNEGDLTHQYKSLVSYDLPFGQGRRFGSGAGGAMDRLIGGWQVALSSVIHSGQLVDFGNVRLVGMSTSDVQKMVQLRFDPSGAGLVYMLPADVITNTINAFNVSATSASGYAGTAPTGRYFAPANGPDCIEVENSRVGKCGAGSVVVAGPLFQQHDITVAKRTKVVGHTTGEFRLEMLNAFNHANFTPGGTGTTSTNAASLTNYQLTALSGTNTSRTVQLVFRFNW